MPANDQYWRDLGTMHKVFAGSAFALFAATLAIGVFLVPDRPTDRRPEIRFVDLGSAPAVEFAVLRHGLDH